RSVRRRRGRRRATCPLLQRRRRRQSRGALSTRGSDAAIVAVRHGRGGFRVLPAGQRRVLAGTRRRVMRSDRIPAEVVERTPASRRAGAFELVRRRVALPQRVNRSGLRSPDARGRLHLGRTRRCTRCKGDGVIAVADRRGTILRMRRVARPQLPLTSLFAACFGYGSAVGMGTGAVMGCIVTLPLGPVAVLGGAYGAVVGTTLGAALAIIIGAA